MTRFLQDYAAAWEPDRDWDSERLWSPASCLARTKPVNGGIDSRNEITVFRIGHWSWRWVRSHKHDEERPVDGVEDLDAAR
jgi:hypothetical protein